nr:immunoglobulin light chain junction region [Macaca mulatta]MOX97500.1 immunoglobulin light chain junction region [Macaca mulatta]MOX97830.1 immunoglobulin light chain junction region [Macaca mulatta]MOX97877.1 immunoglobulin light chain junction region [Macaca mulatta]MOX98778.1 immunoglobulin light chain junction region [Macaca mulatta]
CQHSYRTPFTF